MWYCKDCEHAFDEPMWSEDDFSTCPYCESDHIVDMVSQAEMYEDYERGIT